MTNDALCTAPGWRLGHSLLVVGYAVAALCGMSACSIDQQGFGVAKDPAQLLSYVEFEYGAYNLSKVAPYDTVTLHVRGVSGTGGTIDAPVVFTADPRYVTVSANGNLRAEAPVARTWVKATVTHDGVAHTDSAMVTIINEAPKPLSRLAIALEAGDSAKGQLSGYLGGQSRVFRLIREDSSGATLSAVRVGARSSDTATAIFTQATNLDDLTVQARRPGRVMLSISAYAYGVGKRDSLSFLVGWPLGAYVIVYPRYNTGSLIPVLDVDPGRITVAVGSCVVWVNRDTINTMDIVFDDSLHVDPPDSAAYAAACLRTVSFGGVRYDWGGGNIAPWKYQPDNNDFFSLTLSPVRARAFRKPGIYTYHSVTHGTTGTIVVCDERHDQTCSPENYQWGEVNP